MGGAGVARLLRRDGSAEAVEPLLVGLTHHLRELREPGGRGAVAIERGIRHAGDYALERRRCRKSAGCVDEMAAAPVDRRGIAELSLAVCEVLRIDDAAGRGDIRHEPVRDIAAIEIVEPGLCQPFDRVAELAELHEAGNALIGRHRRQAARQVDARAFSIEAKDRGRGGDLQRRVPVGRQAAPGERNGRCEDVGERQLRAEGFLELLVAGDGGGRDEGEGAVDVAVVDHLRPGEEVLLHLAGEGIIGGIGAAWRDRPEIDDLRAALAGFQHDGEADAAESAVPGLDRGQSEAGGDGGIGGIAALFEDRGSGFGRLAALRDDDAVPAARGGFGQSPVLAAIGKGGSGHAKTSRR